MNERERIELLMKCYELTPSQFADRTGIQRASVSHIISGRNKPSLEVMLKIYDAFPGIDMKWLMTGVGEEPTAAKFSTVTVAPSAASVEPAPVQQGAVASLFDVPEQPAGNVEPVMCVADTVPKPRQPKVQQRIVVEPRVKRGAAARMVQAMAQQERRIKEVRVYYTDGTFEVLFPEG